VSFSLDPHPTIKPGTGPLLLVILDGVGIGNGDAYDAVAQAKMPTLMRLRENSLYRTLRAHGTAVGMPSDDDMGNSEVGHNAMGAGRIYEQGALQVNRAIASGSLFLGAAWERVMQTAMQGGAIHFLGLLSDGNVHAHIQHLFALLRAAAKQGASKLYVHALLDGRDVPRDSALLYVDMLEQVLSELRAQGVDAAIASGGGRMQITMDRYNADWPMVERGYHIHVHGEGRRFKSTTEAVLTYRSELPNIDDQNLPGFVIERDGQALAPIRTGDAVVNFNFRGDRAIEISRAFEEDDFPFFKREPRPRVNYVGMMLYDGDTQTPKSYLVPPPAIDRTMTEYLVKNGISQYAISETQKYGHVTYFWNGNKSGRIDDRLEVFSEIPSDVVPFDQRPWMKAAEITDRLIAELKTGKHRFARVNYANGDMVGHTGSLTATILAMEAVDLELGRLVEVVDALKGRLIITADHGNADEMVQHDKSGALLLDKVTGEPIPKTSHTLNPVPCIVHCPDLPGLTLAPRLEKAGIANVTATAIELLGRTAPSDMEPSLLRSK
jgi:2,3-bisphosphoglycerate-independent phosphoglycerate mutase